MKNDDPGLSGRIFLVNIAPRRNLNYPELKKREKSSFSSFRFLNEWLREKILQNGVCWARLGRLSAVITILASPSSRSSWTKCSRKVFSLSKRHKEQKKPVRFAIFISVRAMTQCVFFFDRLKPQLPHFLRMAQFFGSKRILKSRQF